MSGAVAAMTTAAALLGAANAGLSIYEKWLRQAHLGIDQAYSRITACGPDALAYQVDVRLHARGGDVYLTGVWFDNRPRWWDPERPHRHDPDDIARLEAAQFYQNFKGRLGYDLDPEAFATAVDAAEGIRVCDLRVPAGGILTVTIAGVLRETGAPGRAYRQGWWLVVDHVAGRTEEKVFYDL